LETLTLEDLGNGRTRLHAISVVDTMEARDAMVASGMETGIVEGYERLDELLAR
ncbi:MAG: polyketide cyclase, partial [Pseudonocardiales bacterium]|nr:polyketide cyclase [Pseudonocardiales bacterium]